MLKARITQFNGVKHKEERQFGLRITIESAIGEQYILEEAAHLSRDHSVLLEWLDLETGRVTKSQEIPKSS